MLESVAAQTRGLQTLQSCGNTSHRRTSGQNDLARRFDAIARQHDMWIAQHQQYIHKSLKRWRCRGPRTSTCFVRILSPFGIERDLKSKSALLFRVSSITLPLMLMRDKLHDTIFELSDTNKIRTHSDSVNTNDRRIKRRTPSPHIEIEARWVLHHIRTLIKTAHKASYLAEDNTTTDSWPETMKSKFCKTTFGDDCLRRGVTCKPFHHERIMADSSGFLRLKWDNLAVGAFVLDFFSMACVPSHSFITSTKGFTVAFVNVRPVVPHTLYRSPDTGNERSQLAINSAEAVRGSCIPDTVRFLHLAARYLLHAIIDQWGRGRGAR